MPRLYSWETFGPDYRPPSIILRNLQDESWGNDSCPKFTAPGFVVWCDHPDPWSRECSGPRFSLWAVDDELTPDYDAGPIVESDNVDDIVTALRAHGVEMNG